jgi:hypothetical protein
LLFNPKVLSWLIADNSPVVSAIESGWLGTNGHGPWKSGVMERALESLDYAIYAVPDKDLGVLIVGRSIGLRNRYWTRLLREKAHPFGTHQEMFFSKLVTGRDPFDADDSDLLDAFAKDHQALQFPPVSSNSMAGTVFQ